MKKKLRLEYVDIKDARFDARTFVEGGVLHLNVEEMIAQIRDPRIRSIQIDLARPGDRIRIIPVKDVIEPRIKVSATPGFFPGVLDKFESVGEGTTRVLRGCGVVTAGSIVGFQEGLIDMFPPGADATHYSKLVNVVVTCEPVDGLHPTEHEAAVRSTGLRAALYLARTALNAQASSVEESFLDDVHPGLALPRIAYVYQVLAEGLLHDNYIYGIDAKRLPPLLVDPNDLSDGILVSGNCVTACDKNTTYDHANNPVVREMLVRHGKEMEFVGVVLCPVSPTLAEKERNAALTLGLLKSIGAEGIVVSEEGGGNPEADLMMLCKMAENAGIATVLMLHENAGEDGTSEPITNSVPEADAVISVGNCNQILRLPPADKVIGNLEAARSLSGASKQCLRDDGSLDVPYAVIMDSVSNLGITKMSGRSY